MRIGLVGLLGQRAALLVISVALSGCGTSRGSVFLFPDSGMTPDGGPASPQDGGQDAMSTCDSPPNFLEGNAPELAHACGYSCDSDWCNCESCAVQTGPGLGLPAGDYLLTFIGGATDPITYEFEAFDRTDGRSLALETIRYHGFFDHRLRFVAPPGCHQVDFIVRQLDSFCSRIYETFIDRE